MQYCSTIRKEYLFTMSFVKCLDCILFLHLRLCEYLNRILRKGHDWLKTEQKIEIVYRMHEK